MVEYFLLQFETEVVLELAHLRRSLIYNDANDYNILVSKTPEGRWQITGLIDFGDMVESYLLFEPAAALAYTYTRRREMIVIDHAYHGNASALIDLSPYKFNSATSISFSDFR